jgi:hypothetical protein
MTEEYTWDQVDVDENITKTDHLQSNDIETRMPVGVMLCEVFECTPIEKTLSDYSCMVAKLRMRIKAIYKVEQPIMDGKGNPIKRDGEIVKKVQDILPAQQTEIEALFLGQFITDEIFLFHPKEKKATKKRRLFVAKRLGLITTNDTNIGGAIWANAPGHTAVITTEWNVWKDKLGEIQKSVRVGWAGYDFPVSNTNVSPGANAPANTNDFSGI